MLHSSRVEMRTSPECVRMDTKLCSCMHAQCKREMEIVLLQFGARCCSVMGRYIKTSAPLGRLEVTGTVGVSDYYSFLVKLAHAVKWALPFLHHHTCKLYYSGCKINAYHRNVKGHHSVTISSLV